MSMKCSALFRSRYDVTKKDRENDSHSSLTKHVFYFQKDYIRYKKKWVEARPYKPGTALRPNEVDEAVGL